MHALFEELDQFAKLRYTEDNKFNIDISSKLSEMLREKKLFNLQNKLKVDLPEFRDNKNDLSRATIKKMSFKVSQNL